MLGVTTSFRILLFCVAAQIKATCSLFLSNGSQLLSEQCTLLQNVSLKPPGLHNSVRTYCTPLSKIKRLPSPLTPFFRPHFLSQLIKVVDLCCLRYCLRTELSTQH
uniref:Putative secreted protein n=1 Tax=Amblyomma cajennense TaxID=34607 RepID=A0A023FDR5_AMBCJ